MNRKVAVLLVLVPVVALGAAAVAYLRCGSCSSVEAAACAAPGAPTGDYDRTQSLGCTMSCAMRDVPEGTVVVAQPGAKEGDVTRCPVSGVAFTVTAAGSSAVVGGRTYRTCCASCAGMLLAEPSRFVHS